MKGRTLVFLVRRMRFVVVEPEADQQRIHAQFAFEGADDWDRAARADQRRRFAPFAFERTPVIDVFRELRSSQVRARARSGAQKPSKCRRQRSRCGY